MKVNFKIIGVVLCFLLSVQVVAQTKVLDRSSRKKPSWLKERVEGCLRVNVRKPTLHEAQEEAMCKVKEKIAQSLTQNRITQSSRHLLNTVDDDACDVGQKYLSFTKFYTARLPFIRSISISKVHNIYWQKIKNKNKIYIDYYLLYPYPKADQKRLKRQFDRLNKEMNRQLSLLEERQTHVKSLADINVSLCRIRLLEKFFLDKEKRELLNNLRLSYKKMYRSIFIEGAFKSPNEYVCQVMLKGKPIAIDCLPRFHANCASKITLHQEGTEIFVRFSTENCRAMEENYIDLNFTIEGERRLHRFYVTNENEVTLDLIPEGAVSLSAEAITAQEVKNLTLKFAVNNRNARHFTLMEADFYVPDLQSPISITQLNAVYHKAGSVTFELKAKGVWRLNRDVGHGIRFIKGAFEVKDQETGRTKRILVNLPYNVNW